MKEITDEKLHQSLEDSVEDPESGEFDEHTNPESSQEVLDTEDYKSDSSDYDVISTTHLSPTSTQPNLSNEELEDDSSDPESHLATDKELQTFFSSGNDLKKFKESKDNVFEDVFDNNNPILQPETSSSNYKTPSIDPDLDEELTFGMKQVIILRLGHHSKGSFWGPHSLSLIIFSKVGCAIENPSRIWRVLSIGISTVGLCIIVPGFGMFLFALWKREMVLLRHEMFAPIGLILLFLSVAVFGMQVSVTSCALKRILPSKFRYLVKKNGLWCDFTLVNARKRFARIPEML